MNVKTIALSGAEMAVTVGGSHAEVKNNGTDIIYASANSGIVAGADGVVSIPAGSAVTVLDTRGEVYLLGTGGAEIVGKDFVSQVFKVAATSGGGTTEDEVARNAISAHSGNAEIHVTARDKEKWNMSVAFVTFNSHVSNSTMHTTAEEKAAWNAKANQSELTEHTEDAEIHITAAEKAAWNAKAELSDIPTSLPANGGNSDTVGGLSISKISHGYSVPSNQDADLCLNSGYYMMDYTAVNIPVSDYGLLVVSNGDDPDTSNTWISQTFFAVNGVDNFHRMFVNGGKSDWMRINDGGNAASVGSYTEEKIAALEARIAALEGK